MWAGTKQPNTRPKTQVLQMKEWTHDACDVYRNSVNIHTNLLFVSWQVYESKIKVNINVWNIKLTVKKSYGKQHVGAGFPKCPRCTVLCLRLVQLWVSYFTNSIRFVWHDHFSLIIFCDLFFVNVNIYENIIYKKMQKFY